MKKKVLVLSSHTPSLFWFRLDMMREFVARGWQVYAVANESEKQWKHVFFEYGIEYRKIEVQRNGVNPINDFKTLYSIYRVLKSIHPEKIFAFQAKTIIYGAMAAYLVQIDDVYPLIAGIGSTFLSNTLKARVLRRVLTIEYTIAFKKCHTLFFQNVDDVRVFRDLGIIKNQNAVLLHGSGVNIEKYSVFPLPSTTAFICIGRLIRDKGIVEYLDACRLLKSRYPRIRCLLVGPFDTNPSAIKPEELNTYISDGVIEFYGEQKDVRPFLKQASVFVLPSYREGTPKTVLEAMACGRAVITTNAPGCKETVVDGKNGFLVPIKDVDSLYEKMCWFVENADEIGSMGLIGRKMAEETFDVNKVNQTICETMGI